MGLYMDTRLVQKLKLPLIPLSTPIKVYNVDNTENIGGKIQHQVNIAYSIYGQRLHSTFLITTLGKQEVILGLLWLEEINPDINWKTHKLSWRTTKTIHNIYSILSHYPPSDDQLIASLEPKFAKEEHKLWNERKMNTATLLTYLAEKEKVESIKKKSLEEQVPVEFHKYLSVFSEQEASRMPEHTSYDHKIDLKEDFEPKRSKIYWIDPVNEETFNKFINKNLQKGYI